MRVEPFKAWLVASREYLDNVRTRGFWLSLLLMPVLLLVLVVAPVLLADVESAARYAVFDQSGWVQRAVAVQIAHNDAAALVEALENLSAAERPAGVAAMPPLPTAQSRSQFAAATAEWFVRLQSQRTAAQTPATPEERIARWWYDDPEAAIRIAPDLSSAHFRYVPTPGQGRADLNERLADDSLLGYFVIPDDPVADGRDALYVTRKLTNLEVRNWYAALVTNVVRDRRIREENIASSTADWIQAPIAFDTTRLTESGAETAAGLGDTLTQWAPVAFVYLLWISIFSVTQMLLTNTVEEKSNKLIEVLLSSIRPVDLMAGKILGIAATGITIVGSWLAIFVAVVLWLPGLLGAPVSVDLSALVDQPIYLVSFLVYFLLGYLFYAALLCGIGSMANNLKEAQTLMMPIQLLLVVPLIVMVPIGRDPHGLLAQVLSWLPPLTPFVMMNRAALPPGVITYVGTTLLMLASIYAALALAARVFESGILMTGKPPRLRHLVQLLRGNRP
jgi:ABC-2 type transport system permease protein